MYYTYMHTRNDTGKPFYIGKGKGNRATLHSGRSEHWKRIVSKHGHQVHILSKWTSEREAFEHEKLLIACMRDISAPIINVTDGGEGTSGRKISMKNIAALIARNSSRVVSQETRDRISMALTGKPTGRHTSPSSDVRLRISQSLKGRKVGLFDEKHRANISASAKIRAVRNAKPVLCVELGLVFATAMDAQSWLRNNGHPRATRGGVLNVCQKKPRYHTAYGYHWKYKE